MSFLVDLRKRIHYFLLKRKLHACENNNEAVNYHAAKEVIILYECTDPLQKHLAENYLEKLRLDGKHVKLFAYSNKKKKDNTLANAELASDDINLVFNPDPAIVNPVINKDFDLLIDLHSEECLPLEYIAALSKAKCRVGKYMPDKTHCYDLMINLDEQDDTAALMEQIDYYLNLINHAKQSA